MPATGFQLGLGCDCCEADCKYSLCIRTFDRCDIRFPGNPPYVRCTVTFDGPGGAHHEIDTGGGGFKPTLACLADPAEGEWTITATPHESNPDFKPKTVTVTVVECESQTVRLELCPSKKEILVFVAGCRPPEDCGPITVELSGPGVISALDPDPFGPPTPTGSPSADYWDYHPTPGAVRFVVDLSDVDMDGDCGGGLSWTATATPPAGTGLAPASASTPDGTDACFESWISITFDEPEGTACCNGIAYPAEFEVSDDWGTATLVHGTPSNILATWIEGSPPLATVAPWIGTMTFTCEDGCEDVPCYDYSFGVFSSPIEVTVTIAATCPGGKVYKLFEIRPGCNTGRACLHSLTPMSGNPVAMCRMESSFVDPDPCSAAILASGSWTMATLNGGCLGTAPGFADTPCVGGEWTLSGGD